jgi:hypothetical protein
LPSESLKTYSNVIEPFTGCTATARAFVKRDFLMRKTLSSDGRSGFRTA